MSGKKEQVLVTGGTGFITQHGMRVLLNDGYCVRTMVRTLARVAEVRVRLGLAVSMRVGLLDVQGCATA